MGIPLLIMAGGRSTRFDFTKLKAQVHEKALLKLGTQFFIERVIEAGMSASNISQIYVAVSPVTPKTREFLLNFSPKVILCDTPGKGYHEDLIYAVKELELGVVLTTSTDIPLITNSHIDQILIHYRGCKKPALTVMSPFSRFRQLGLSATNILPSPEYMDGIVPLGLNVIDGNLIDQPALEQAIYIMEESTLLFNINTIADYNVLIEKYGDQRA